MKKLKGICFQKSNGYYSISLQLEIVPVNDAPSLSFLGGGNTEQYSYTEDDPAINIGANLTLTDVDDISIQSVALYLTGKAHTLLCQNQHLLSYAVNDTPACALDHRDLCYNYAHS